MAAKPRLDAELVKRGLAKSREAAVHAIENGEVIVNGIVRSKPASTVEPEASIVVKVGSDERYASRGAFKLLGALTEFEPQGLSVKSRRALDAGASTGGFTDILLKRGAAEVVAVDVGYGQLVWELQQDPRVTVHDRTNVRNLSLEQIGAPVDVVVADLSFISLVLVLPALVSVIAADADMVLMVKPQFEVGREKLGAGGVVRDPALRSMAVHQVARAAAELGLGVCGIVASPLPGPAGNVEYFLWLRKDAPSLDSAMVSEAIAQGPA